MIRRFGFEDEMHQSLACVPMAVRRKLDRAGVKISLKQWQALAHHERAAVCHLPAGDDDERAALRDFLAGALTAREAGATKPLPAAEISAADPPDEPPARLIDNARATGVTIGAGEWSRLDADERYALIKLGGGVERSHNFRAALKELIG